MQQYHNLSDATMDKMLDSLEVLVDRLGRDGYDVEYSVRIITSLSLSRAS
jgi:frataxin